MYQIQLHISCYRIDVHNDSAFLHAWLTWKGHFHMSSSSCLRNAVERANGVYKNRLCLPCRLCLRESAFVSCLFQWSKNASKCLSRMLRHLQWDAVAVKLEEESCFKTRLSCSATCGSCLGDLRNRRMRTEWGIVLQCPPMNAFDFESSLNQWSFRKTGPWRW